MPLINPRIDALFASKVTELIGDLDERYFTEAELTTKEFCNNCRYDPIGQASSGVYNGTGPQPFQKKCPVCKGNGKTETVVRQKITATVKLGEAKNGDQPTPEGDLPEGWARIKGLFEEIDILEAATAFFIDNVRFDRQGQIKPRGLQSKVVAIIFAKRSD